MNAARAVAAVMFVSLCCAAVAQTSPTRVRGAIEKFDNGVLTVKSRDRSALKPGAHVFIGAAQRQPDGSLSAGRVNVGIDGLVPPM